MTFLNLFFLLRPKFSFLSKLLILDEGNSMLTLSTRSTKDTDLAKLDVFFQEAMGNKAGKSGQM